MVFYSNPYVRRSLSQWIRFLNREGTGKDRGQHLENYIQSYAHPCSNHVEISCNDYENGYIPPQYSREEYQKELTPGILVECRWSEWFSCDRPKMHTLWTRNEIIQGETRTYVKYLPREYSLLYFTDEAIYDENGELKKRSEWGPCWMNGGLISHCKGVANQADWSAHH